ncbi:MAG TPA: HAMP domain-containing sensor histidine kinase [Gemmatimonadaceae bacterium]|nr:HAMP domain-containing sensor histidine kinase [Gemmatimonadaceae bacterium]
MAIDATSSRGGLQRLIRLRIRLTIWYLATFGTIILLLGVGLFIVIRNQLSKQLNESLNGATTELVRAARIRELEDTSARGGVIDAVDELNIPDRMLYLFDLHGNPIKPDKADPWVKRAALQAALHGQATLQEALPPDKTLRAHAVRFRLKSGEQMVAVALADQEELANKYADLIEAFIGIALFALVLVAAGGFVVVRKSTAPVERSIEYMRRFMADAAHELRTPITILRTRAEIALQQSRDPKDYVSALSAVEAEARRLGGIVDSLLVLARADTGERQIERERIFLDDIAVDAAGAARIVARQKGVDMKVEEFEETPVIGDATLIRQLLMILLDNAVKFTDSGGEVTVRVAMHDGVPTVIVEDTGIGIRHEELSMVFERFFRGENARSHTDGAGLGLSIASWIAREHGAEIALQSKPSKGTKAIVTFPKAASAATPSRQV